MKRILLLLLTLMMLMTSAVSCSEDTGSTEGTKRATAHKEKEPEEVEDPYITALQMIDEYQDQIMSEYPPASPDENTVDIILFAGQSNSSGKATADEIEGVGDEFVEVDISKAFTFYNDRYTEPMAIVEPILGNGTEEKYYGYVPAFLDTYYDNTGRRVCACFKSVGGTMMNTFFPYSVDANGNEIDEPQKFYSEIVKYIDHAKTNLAANGYNVGHIFMVWCQGEAEAAYYGSENKYANYYEAKLTEYEDKKNYYKESFERIFDALKQDTGLEKAFVVSIGYPDIREEAMRNQCIIEAQHEICLENEDLVLVTTLFAGAKCYREEDGSVTNLMKDGSHYSLRGYLMAGKEAALNTAIYVNSSFAEEPMLMQYHSVYLESQGIEDDTEYENAQDKYIYRP